jgi:apurinic endonuclease APN1
MGNPKAFKRHRVTLSDQDFCRDLIKKNPVNVYTHYPYTSSLLGTVASLAWNGDDEQDKKTTNILKELEYEINTISKISDVSGVVIHPGSFKNRTQGLETISKSINKINFEPGSKILLENSAGEGTKLPRDFQELSKIFEGIDIDKYSNVGCCIDTAHIWGAGIYNLSKRDDIDKMFHEFDKYVGLDKFNLLHLNDSSVPLGSKKDRHECLTSGYIWRDDVESLKYLLVKCGENNIPIILETPDIRLDLDLIENF